MMITVMVMVTPNTYNDADEDGDDDDDNGDDNDSNYDDYHNDVEVDYVACSLRYLRMIMMTMIIVMPIMTIDNDHL